MTIQPDPMGEELKNYQSDLSGLASLLEVLLNSTGAGIYIVQDKKFIYVNPFFEELSGFKMRELVGTPSLNLVHPDDRAMVRKKVTKILKKKSKANTYEYRFLKKNGDVVWVIERITSMEYMGHRAAMGSFMDINQRKVLEEDLAKSEEWHRAILEQMQDGCYEVDLQGNYIFVNDAMCRGMQYSPDELLGQKTTMVVPEEDNEMARQKFVEVFQTGKPCIGLVHRVRRKDGVVGWVEQSVSLMKNQSGQPYGFLCVARNITERKMLEDALAASEERYRTILQQMHDSCYGLDLDGNFIFINDGVCRDTGYTRDELIGKNGDVLIPEEIRKARKKEFAEVLRTGEPKTNSVSQVTRKNREVFYMESSISLLKGPVDEPAGFLCVGRDITQRKALEEALAVSEERYRSMLDRMLDSYYEVDLAGNFTYLNAATCQHLGYEKGELDGKNYRVIMPEDEIDTVFSAFHRVYETGEPNTGFYHRIIRKDRTIGFAESSIGLLQDKQGHPIGFSCLGRDISERKKLEDELKRSEERYRNVLEQMPDMYYEVDLKGSYVYVNKAYCEFGGYSEEELLKSNFRRIVDPALQDSIYKKFNEVFRTGQTNRGFSYRFIARDGTEKYIETSVRLLKDKDGKARGFSCFSRDVTERTRLEQEVQRSEEKYRTMLEQMQDGYYEVDLKGNYTFANTAAATILGVPKEQLIGTNYRVLAPPDEIERVFKTYNKVYKSGIPINAFAHEITIKDGESIQVESSVDVRKNERGEIIGFRSVVRDVTERKRLEAALSLSEEKYRSILEEMEDAYYEVDLSGNFTFVNEATSRHTGYSGEELTQMNFRQVTYEEDINPVFTSFNNVYRSGEPNKGYSHRMVKKDGTVGYVEAAISVSKDKQGAIVGFRCVSRDVTERKLLEQKLADMATHDFLTGLPNRILLNDRFQVALAQANRNNYKLGIMSLDLDHFKEVNDTMGHAVGDQLLKAAGARLSNILRSSDTVARLGGDEFLLLLQEIHYPEDAILIAQKIIDSCKEPIQINGHQLHISTSIGIAIYPDNGEDMDTLMRKSDAAMYFSKRHGGMQYKVFTTSDQLDISQS